MRLQSKMLFQAACSKNTTFQRGSSPVCAEGWSPFQLGREPLFATADEFLFGVLVARGTAWSSTDTHGQGCSSIPHLSKDRYSYTSWEMRNTACKKVTQLSPTWEAPKNCTETRRLRILLMSTLLQPHFYSVPAIKYNERGQTASHRLNTDHQRLNILHIRDTVI